MAKKERIATNQDHREELANPFAALQVDVPAGTPAPPPTAPVSEPPPKRKRGRVVLRRETAHRGGKCVIVVYDFPSTIPTRDIEDLGKRLRSVCGCGGTVRERIIELQGDQPARIRSFLEEEGFRVAGIT